MPKYNVTFKCVWEVEVEADSEDEAKDGAYIVLFDDLRHNAHAMFEIESVK